MIKVLKLTIILQVQALALVATTSWAGGNSVSGISNAPMRAEPVSGISNAPVRAEPVSGIPNAPVRAEPIYEARPVPVAQPVDLHNTYNTWNTHNHKHYHKHTYKTKTYKLKPTSIIFPGMSSIGSMCAGGDIYMRTRGSRCMPPGMIDDYLKRDNHHDHAILDDILKRKRAIEAAQRHGNCVVGRLSSCGGFGGHGHWGFGGTTVINMPQAKNAWETPYYFPNMGLDLDMRAFRAYQPQHVFQVPDIDFGSNGVREPILFPRQQFGTHLE